MFLKKLITIRFVCILIGFILLVENVGGSMQGAQVSKWANAIGNKLWALGGSLTKYREIEEAYKFLNAKVGREEPRLLLEEVKQNILRMMDRKMDAIKCIQQEAELRSEQIEYSVNQTAMYQYYSSKYSPIIGEPPYKLPKALKKNKSMYMSMKLNNDTHFYNLAVNTTHSSVHIPTNVYDRRKDVSFAVQWSQYLDDVFVQNYNSDPALSWQYFGSSSGIMRHYPAKRWAEIKKDQFDCRKRTWYIEAATCTKDVIILMDSSGSMDGMGKHIGALTVNTILDTFSNNDYVNVLNYSLTTNYTIPCFENLLVQATRENVALFKEAVKRLKPDDKTNLSQALEFAFNLFSANRKKRGHCDKGNSTCNEAIMIITDGIRGNLSDTISKYYDNNNGTLPRLFTYLIGKEVTNIPDIQWIACTNRGYHTHVQSLEQVTASVLKYINVIARPLVLQREEHPVSWTHSYIDLTYDDANDNTINEPFRLLTSAAIPCFDRKLNNNNDSITADLLGVAATDVPIDDFRKLTLPYKLGVNAYAFIVSNNGYVLMHPDLRPMFDGILKENYNSIDLTEVEQHVDLREDGLASRRDITDALQRLRSDLVNGKDGSIHNVSLRYHYNDMRRVSHESYDYYYTRLEKSPFSIAIAIPSKYGNYSLNVKDEIKKNRHTGQDLTDFFVGKWKVHPKWVYCKYHYLEGHEYKTPEKELLHFLKRMYDDDFKWEGQYEVDPHKSFLDEVECGRKTHDDDDYYCDRQLVQRLIFDAENTAIAFDVKDKSLLSREELERFKTFNATLRFVATMSGLTRWEYISDEVLNATKKEFGDIHARAIDETWYKSAVLQHQYDTESFVYSVPFDAGSKDTVVTGSYAIFLSEAGLQAPGCVVGYQFSQNKLKEAVQNISNKISNDCMNCGSCNTTLDCYVIDSSGYILVSEDNNDTGKFFGEIEGDVMNSMLEEELFLKITLYDHQGLCRYDEDPDYSSAIGLLTPFQYVNYAINWIAMKLFMLAMEINLNTFLINPISVFAQNLAVQNRSDEEVDVVVENGDADGDGDGDDDDDDDDDDSDDTFEENDANQYFACEKQIDLFVLQQHMAHNFTEDINKNTSRPYFVKKINFSNLIFVAINTTVPVTNSIRYTVSSKQISKAPKWEVHFLNSTLLPCQKLHLGLLERAPLQGCFNEHPLEYEINTCGNSNRIEVNILLLVISINFLFLRLGM